MNALTTEQQATWDALISHPVPFTAEQMSGALYRYLCDDQLGEHAYGEDSKGNSMEITWIGSRGEWQVIDRFADGQCRIIYDDFWEGTWEDEDPELLYSMLNNLGLVEELQERLEEEADTQ